MRRGIRLVGVMAIAALIPGAGRDAQAQTGWEASPHLISAVHANGANMLTPKVGVDGAGNAIAVWVETGTSIFVVRSARYSRAAGAWGAAVTLSDTSAPQMDDPQLAVDAAGNAVATWIANGGPIAATPRAARYSASAGTWSDVPLPATTSGRIRVAANAAGDAVIVWNLMAGPVFAPPVSLQAIRFSMATGTWSAPEVLAATLPMAPANGSVAMDGAGNIHVVWLGQASTQTTRFAAATGTWGGVTDLSAPIANLGVDPPHIAANGAGDAVVSWSRANGVEVARWRAGASAWDSPVTVAAATFSDVTRTAVDAGGNAFVAWTSNTGSSPRQLSAARYDVAASTWSSAAPLSSGGVVLGWPSIACDGYGNAFAAWTEQTPPGGGAAVFVARYATTTGAWVVSSPLSAVTQTAFNPGIAADLAGNAVMVWHQTAGALAATLGLRFTATPPAPVVTEVLSALGALHVALSFPVVSDPSLAATTVEYSLDDGATWTARSPASIASPLTISGLTDGGTHALRLRAVNFAGAGPSTPALRVRSGAGTVPTDLRVVSRTGNTVTFAWVEPPAGIVPDGYLLEGRISGQTQVLASLPTGGTATQLTLDVLNGTFDVWVVAVTGGRRLGQTAPLQIAVNTLAFPSSPSNLLASAAGDTLALSWTNTWSGAALTGLRLLVGGGVTASVSLPVTESFTYTGVPPGTYTFVVAALNGGAPGGATSAVQLTFPGACPGPPNPPVAFSVTTQGGRVFLDWLPPSSGAAATSYVLAVSGALNGALSTTTRSLAVPVGAGSYTVRVASTGPCGTSPFTAPQTVVVP